MSDADARPGSRPDSRGSRSPPPHTRELAVSRHCHRQRADGLRGVRGAHRAARIAGLEQVSEAAFAEAHLHMVADVRVRAVRVRARLGQERRQRGGGAHRRRRAGRYARPGCTRRRGRRR